jgi:carbon storage regulator
LLVLSRKAGETIILGDDIEVKVLSISRSVVRLGFAAPPSVVIRRAEISPLPKKPNNEKEK